MTTALFNGETWYVLLTNSFGRSLITRNGESRWVDTEDLR